MALPTDFEIRCHLENWLAQAVTAVEPYEATRRALAGAPSPAEPPGILAVGKAAEGMARAAIDWLAEHGLEAAGGLVVSDHFDNQAPARLQSVTGDHPVPGERSRNAADAIAGWIASLPPRTPTHVFISGGTSSLIAAPIEGIEPGELGIAFDIFHALGLDIETMNGLRRRLTRWSNGRLAAALGERSVHAWVISDVIGGDPAVIGSGPMLAKGLPMEAVMKLMADPRMLALPARIREALGRDAPATAAAVPHRIVADGPQAANALAEHVRRDGMEATVHARPIVGEATEAGHELARWIGEDVRRHRLPSRASGILVTPVPRTGVVHIWHSETSVSLPDDHGLGGRAQQFALAVAQQVAHFGWPEAVTVMIAGTDGRDGPTDAAGAIVNAGTLLQLEAAGVDVTHALQHCDAHPALDKVGALLRTGRTGTNVADLVVVWMWNWY